MPRFTTSLSPRYFLGPRLFVSTDTASSTLSHSRNISRRPAHACRQRQNAEDRRAVALHTFRTETAAPRSLPPTRSTRTAPDRPRHVTADTSTGRQQRLDSGTRVHERENFFCVAAHARLRSWNDDDAVGGVRAGVVRHAARPGGQRAGLRFAREETISVWFAYSGMQQMLNFAGDDVRGERFGKVQSPCA